MEILCEVMVSDILPAFRALLANELTQRYGLNQLEVSEKLGITQPAVSQYIRGLRGYNVRLLQSNKTVVEFVKNLSSQIASGEIKSDKVHEKICEVCEIVRKEKIVHQESTYPIADTGE
jgi:predicted transcriptional regulator